MITGLQRLKQMEQCETWEVHENMGKHDAYHESSLQILENDFLVVAPALLSHVFFLDWTAGGIHSHVRSRSYMKKVCVCV